MRVFQGWKIRARSSLLVMWSPRVSCLQMYHLNDNWASCRGSEWGRNGLERVVFSFVACNDFMKM